MNVKKINKIKRNIPQKRRKTGTTPPPPPKKEKEIKNMKNPRQTNTKHPFNQITEVLTVVDLINYHLF